MKNINIRNKTKSMGIDLKPVFPSNVENALLKTNVVDYNKLILDYPNEYLEYKLYLDDYDRLDWHGKKLIGKAAFTFDGFQYLPIDFDEYLKLKEYEKTIMNLKYGMYYQVL